jgi:hypothetical protein
MAPAISRPALRLPRQKEHRGNHIETPMIEHHYAAADHSDREDDNDPAVEID